MFPLLGGRHMVKGGVASALNYKKKNVKRFSLQYLIYRFGYWLWISFLLVYMHWTIWIIESPTFFWHRTSHQGEIRVAQCPPRVYPCLILCSSTCIRFWGVTVLNESSPTSTIRVLIPGRAHSMDSLVTVVLSDFILHFAISAGVWPASRSQPLAFVSII